MAFNSLAFRYNQEYLKKQIKNTGIHDKTWDTFSFKVMDNLGNPGGYEVTYSLRNGLVTRTSIDGNSVVRGLADDSWHQDGRITVEICVPYDEDTHFDCEAAKLCRVAGKIVSVKYTCYIHVIAGLILEAIGRSGSGDIVNHIDGCPLHNWASNLERVTRRENSLHGVVVNSLFRSSVCRVGFITNQVNTFPFVNRHIPASAVVEYMQIDQNFKLDVMRLYEQVRCKSCHTRSWLTDTQLMNFLAWGLQAGKIK